MPGFATPSAQGQTTSWPIGGIDMTSHVSQMMQLKIRIRKPTQGEKDVEHRVTWKVLDAVCALLSAIC